MWDYLSKLHPLLLYSIIIITIVAVVIIALKGRLMIKWGKNAIGLGNSAEDTSKKKLKSHGTEVPPSGTGHFEKKRSCSDCLLIITSERNKYELNKKLRADTILTYRMNFTEEKLMELENDITNIFEKKINKFSDERGLIESKMFYGLFKDTLYKVKKEIRRSCKENGFCELTDLEFSNYINDKTKNVLSILIRELKIIYPIYGTIIPIDAIIMDIESLSGNVHDYVEDIFVYAKQVIEEEEKDLKEMENKYQEWSSKFVKSD